MNIVSWLGYSGGAWTWRHYLAISGVALAVSGAVVLWAWRQAKTEGRVARFCGALCRSFLRRTARSETTLDGVCADRLDEKPEPDKCEAICRRESRYGEAGNSIPD